MVKIIYFVECAYLYILRTLELINSLNDIDMIRITKSIEKGIDTVYIIPKEGENREIPSEYVSLVEKMAKEEKNEEFLKFDGYSLFFVKEQDDMEKLRVAGFNIRKQLCRKAKKVAIIGDNAALAVAEGLMLSNYQFLKYFKDREKKEYWLKEVDIYGDLCKSCLDKVNNAITAVYWARDMVNESPSELTSVQLSKEIEEIGEKANFSVTVLDKRAIEKLNMGGLLAVNRGSIDPPTFTIMEYKPENPVNKKPIVFVGKGLVYDTGGLSLKPTQGSMDSMKSDMGGAACMAGAIYAAALSKLNVHVIGLIPSTDNRPGERAYVPGDIVTMFDGTTVEVLNTDAEGRMILADAISYADRYEPELIVDAATLTGAALVAAGNTASCVMGNAERKVMDKMIESGFEVHERLVELPLWDDYKELLKSTVADMKNVGGRFAGTITAGKFLEHFTKHPFIHIDIAGPAFLEAAQDYKGIGGTGTGIRTLLNFLSKYDK